MSQRSREEIYDEAAMSALKLAMMRPPKIKLKKADPPSEIESRSLARRAGIVGPPPYEIEEEATPGELAAEAWAVADAFIRERDKRFPVSL